MMQILIRIRPVVFLMIVMLLAALITQAQQEPKRTRTIIVIFDGLRPEYVTADFMPNLHAFMKAGSAALNHHSVFPTVTRVNASSYITGSYPAKHGLMGNTVYFPEINKSRGLNTGEVEVLRSIAEATHDNLLTTPSLGELLRQAGEEMMVFSSGSSGQAYLQNHKMIGAVVHPEVVMPADLRAEIISRVGDPPPAGKPNTQQHVWVTSALIHAGMAAGGPAVCALWLSDPDGTAHSEGIGAPRTMEALRVVDRQFGRILEVLVERNLQDSFNILVTADHGFATQIGSEGITSFLIKNGLKESEDSGDVVVAGNALYVRDHDRGTIKRIVSALHQQPWIGAIFTKGGKAHAINGWVKGTLSFETIHWDHETRAADILVDYNWDDRKNLFGYAGASFAPGVAGHGGASPYEIHIPLIVSGPMFRKSFQSSTPSSNTDIVPTILYLHGIAVPPAMDGRVLTELLSAPLQGAPAVRKDVLRTEVRYRWGTYQLILDVSSAGRHRYLNFASVRRKIR